VSLPDYGITALPGNRVVSYISLR